MTEETIFETALQKQAPAERSAYLDEACAGDAALRQRVEALLVAHEEAGAFLERPAIEQMAAALQPEDAAVAVGSPPQTDEAVAPALLRDRLVETQAGRPGGDAEGIALDFLEPPHKPGSLGRLGHYEILEVIGRGGMGIVLKAFDTVVHRTVAVKVMAPQLAATATARKRFLREARAAGAVSHDHVVTIHAVEEAGGLPYLVMQYVHGLSLQERLDRSGPLELKEILRIGLQTAEGLAAAHAQGLIHRDIKPGNILLENGVERVRITDFGLARAVDDASISQSGVVAGTPQYMAPEQAAGEVVDHRADLFSLGSVLYAMCTGHPPFRASGTMAVLKRVCEDSPRPIKETNPEIPDWLCAIVEKLHAKDPADRFQSAREVADLLGQHLAHLQQPALIPVPAPIPRPPVPAKRILLRVKVKAGAKVAVLLCLLVGVGLAVWRGPDLLRYLSNRALLTIDFEDFDLDQVVIRQDGEEVATLDRTHGKEVELPPGAYELEAVGRFGSRAGKLMVDGEVGLHTARWEARRLDNNRFPLELKRGERVRLRLTMVEGPTAPREDGWVQLFNGKDLTGWATDRPDQWTVENSILVSRIPKDIPKEILILTSRDDFPDFHLRAEAKINREGDSGIVFRRTEKFKGYQAQINERSEGRTGSLFKYRDILRRVSDSLVAPDTWFTMEVISHGRQIVIKIDGKTVVDWVDAESAPEAVRGRIGLETGLPGTIVHFRKIEIKELPPTKMAEPAVAAPPNAISV